MRNKRSGFHSPTPFIFFFEYFYFQNIHIIQSV
nr:MAG TPA: hypothetical protein [Caudoviricetes sp.]